MGALAVLLIGAFESGNAAGESTYEEQTNWPAKQEIRQRGQRDAPHRQLVEYSSHCAQVPSRSGVVRPNTHPPSMIAFTTSPDKGRILSPCPICSPAT